MKIFVKNIYEHICKCTKGPAASLGIYWRGYGGFKALVRSIYFLIALALSFLTTIINHFVRCNQWDWCSDVLSVIPSVLGFSLGGYAFLVGFGNEKFMDIMRSKEKSNETSLYIEVNASFIHFIIIQALSVFFALICKSLSLNKIIFFDFVGVFLLFYSMLTIISTSFCVLNLADWFDSMKPPDDEQE